MKNICLIYAIFGLFLGYFARIRYRDAKTRKQEKFYYRMFWSIYVSTMVCCVYLVVG